MCVVFYFFFETVCEREITPGENYARKFRRPNVEVLAIARGTRRRFAAQLLLPLRYVGPSKLRISGTVFILFYFRKRLKGKFAVPALKAINILLIMRSSCCSVHSFLLFPERNKKQ